MLLFSSNLLGTGGTGASPGGGSTLPTIPPIDSIGYTAKLEIKDSSGTPVTLYFCTHKNFSYGGINYVSKITQPSFLGQAIDINSSLGGAISSSVGELLLANVERSLDYLETYIFEGGKLTLNIFSVNTKVVEAVPVLVQTIEQAVFDWSQISIRFIDRSAELDAPLQTMKFLGNNVAPNGVEGNTDLKDKLKPIAFGRVSNATPVLVNSSKYIYMLSTTQFDIIVNVFSNGAYLERSPNVITSLADLQSEAIGKVPAYGYYTLYVGTEGTFIRVANDSGQLTWTGWERAGIVDNTPAQVIKRVLNLFNLPGLTYVAEDFTYIDSKVADNIGILLSDGETVASVVNAIAQSAAIWYGFDGNNQFRLFYFGDFSSSIAVDLYSHSSEPEKGLTSLEIANASYNSKLVPAKQVTLNYDKNWTVQDKATIAGIVVDTFPERINWLSTDTRQAISDTISTNYANAQVLTYDTLLTGDIAAKAEANRLLALLKVKRNIITCTARLTIDELHKLTPCSIARLTLPRFGLDSGNLFVVLSTEINYQTQLVNLILWG